MTVVNFEGLETCGTETGSANQATTRPRIIKRFTSYSGTTDSDSIFLMDDDFGEGYALHMGQHSTNTVLYEIPASWKIAEGPASNEWVVGVRSHIPLTATTYDLWEIHGEFAASSYAKTIRLKVTDSTDLEVMDATTSNVIAGASDVLTPGSWHYIEIRMKFDRTFPASSSVGLIEIKLDGIQVAIKPDEYRVTGNNLSPFSRLIFLGDSGMSDTGDTFIAHDDLYIIQDDGAGQEGFQGNQRVRRIAPNGDDTSDWAPSTGTVNYTMVDENGSDPADYVSSATNSDIDMYDLVDTDISMNGNYHAVKIEVEAINDAAGSPTMDVRLDSNGTVSEENVTVDNTADSIVFTHVVDKDPSGGADFTKARIDALLAGQQVNSGF